MNFSPAGGTFKTETLTVTATLTAGATSGTYKVGNLAQQSIKAGETKTFTVGEGMGYGETVTVTWTATGKEGNESGCVTYKKVDPNAVTNIYVTGKDGADISGCNIWCWDESKNYTGGSWPGLKLSSLPKVDVDGRSFYSFTADTTDPVNVIFSGSSQTGDITGVQGDVYYEYDGASTATEISVTPGPKAPRITANPASGAKFNESVQVTLAVSGASDLYYTLDGNQASASSLRYTGPITLIATTTINAYAKNDVGETHAAFTYTKVDGPIVEDWHAYFENPGNWSVVNAYAWDDDNQGNNAFSGAWPGKNISSDKVTYNGKTLWHYSYTPQGELKNPMIIFNGNGQTGDLIWENNAIYDMNGKTGTYELSAVVENFVAPAQMNVYGYNGMLVVVSNEAAMVTVASIDGKVRQFPVAEGTNYFELPKGFYIANGVKVML